MQVSRAHSIAGLRSKRVQTCEDPGVNGRLLIGNYCEYTIHSISKFFKVGSRLTIKESTYKSIYFFGSVFHALVDDVQDPSCLFHQ